MNTKMIQSPDGHVRPRENGHVSSILLLESDPGLRKSIALSLQQNGIQVLEASDNTEALEILDRVPLTLFIIDCDSSTQCGNLIETFREKSSKQTGNVLLISMERLEDQWRQQYRPDAVIYKPFDIRYLYRRIKNLI